MGSLSSLFVQDCEKIEVLEDEINNLGEQIADPALYLQERNQTRDVLQLLLTSKQQELEQAMQRWDYQTPACESVGVVASGIGGR